MARRIIIMISLLVLVSTAANAINKGPSNREGAWDITIQTRYSGTQEHAGEGGSSSTIESDLGWGFGFAFNANERFNVGLAFTWRSPNYSATLVPEATGEEAGTYSNWLSIGTAALTADWNILPKTITPYVTGALGWTIINTNIPADAYGGCWYDPWYGYVCAGDVATYGSDVLSYSIGVGLRLEVSETVFLRIGYEYDGIDHDGTDGVNIFRCDIGFMSR